jgi:hypothetical protein
MGGRVAAVTVDPAVGVRAPGVDLSRVRSLLVDPRQVACQRQGVGTSASVHMIAELPGALVVAVKPP